MGSYSKHAIKFLEASLRRNLTITTVNMGLKITSHSVTATPIRLVCMLRALALRRCDSIMQVGRYGNSKNLLEDA